MRCSKFSLAWLGYSVKAMRQIRSESIGTERAAMASTESELCIDGLRLRKRFTGRVSGILHRYINDTAATLSEAARVLAPGGRAVFVLGENVIGGAFVPTGRMVAFLAGRRGLR